MSSMGVEYRWAAQTWKKDYGTAIAGRGPTPDTGSAWLAGRGILLSIGWIVVVDVIALVIGTYVGNSGYTFGGIYGMFHRNQ